ncbi:hypothetical protein ACRYCC_28665 [Actinomadura scrupuli]|uniref:hypothetical protein n=1 Tax=Actinomadura scrupuli TaxID=559629 RepID=UPI003D957CF7
MHMHVRLNYIAGDPLRIGDVVKYLENEVRRLVEEQPGSQGMSLAVNAALGVAVLESLWVSGDAMRESERVVAPLRHEMSLRGTATVAVERPGLASMLRLIRPPAGAGVQLTRLDTPVQDVDDMIAAYEDTTVPWLTETSGFCAQRLYVDRGTGRSVSETLWRDAHALAVSRSAAAAVRVDMVAATGSTVRALEEYSLVFSSVRSG